MKKYIFNPFVLVWVLFGVIIYSEYTFEIFNNHLIQQLSYLEWLRYIIPFTLLLLYCVAYFANEKRKVY